MTEEQREKQREARRRYRTTDKSKVTEAAYRIVDYKRAKNDPERMRRKRATRDANIAYYERIKEYSPCMDCEHFYPAECMDFDHVRGEKVNNVGHMVHGSREKLDEEMDKCELVCANCHRIRTKARKRMNVA